MNRFFSTALVLVLVGCDSTGFGDPAPVTYSGARHTAVGASASITVEGSELAFDAPDGGALVVETADFDRADVYFEATGFSSGTLSATVQKGGRPVVTIAQSREGETYSVSATWQALGETATVEALDRDQIVYSGEVRNGGFLGTTQAAATSVHYDAKGHIVYDFEGRVGGVGREHALLAAELVVGLPDHAPPRGDGR